MRRELIFQALDNQPVSRVPTGFWFHFLPQAETEDWRENPRLLELNVAGHQAFLRAHRPDMVKIMTDGFFLYPTPGLFQPVDLSLVMALDPGHNWIRAQASLARRVRAIQEDAAYFYNIFSPITSLRLKIGLERLKLFHQAQPEAFAKALGRLTQGLINLIRSVLVDGKADGIYLSVQNPDQSYFSEDFCRQVLAPGEKALLLAARELGGRNILHICGHSQVRNNLALYADYPAEAFNWAVNLEGVSLGAGRAIFGGRAVLGGFDHAPGSLLTQESRERIKATARELIREAGPEGLILGADCALPSDIELERLEWVREAGLEAIRYGGQAGRAPVAL
ncbi:MAG: uroporphyrinogen decarboxylase [Deltaproteobacteria bacterium]|jgi:uroporphyrinogen decarboxylase|nr:uroporphyrinogen decarboxylase [Deltaproteobacteria bacterium]